MKTLLIVDLFFGLVFLLLLIKREGGWQAYWQDNQVFARKERMNPVVCLLLYTLYVLLLSLPVLSFFFVRDQLRRK